MNPAVSPDPNRVEIRCEDCARDLGPAAPTLVVCSFQTGNWAVGSGLRDHWELIGLGQRRPARAARAVTSGISGRTFDQNTCGAERSSWRAVAVSAGDGADGESYMRWPNRRGPPVPVMPT